MKFKVKICQVIIIEFPFHRGTKIGADKPPSLYSVKAQQAAADRVKRIVTSIVVEQDSFQTEHRIAGNSNKLVYFRKLTLQVYSS